MTQHQHIPPTAPKKAARTATPGWSYLAHKLLQRLHDHEDPPESDADATDDPTRMPNPTPPALTSRTLLMGLRLAASFGSQAAVVSIDVSRDLLGRPRVRTRAGRHALPQDPVAWAREAEEQGAGEILLTAIDPEGTWSGFDLELLAEVSRAVSVPVIAHGGAGRLSHLGEAVRAGASAIALGSMVVFQKQGMGVLVNFPSAEELECQLGAILHSAQARASV